LFALTLALSDGIRNVCYLDGYPLSLCRVTTQAMDRIAFGAADLHRRKARFGSSKKLLVSTSSTLPNVRERCPLRYHPGLGWKALGVSPLWMPVSAMCKPGIASPICVRK